MNTPAAPSPRRRSRALLLPAALGLACLRQLQGALFVGPPGAALRPSARPQGGRLQCRAAGDALEVEGTVEPLGSQILVKLKEAEEFSPGGILLPTKKEAPKGGEVVAVGPGEKDSTTGQLTPMDLKPGAKVVYGRYAGATAVTCGGVDHALVRQSDVLYSYDGEEAMLSSITVPRGVVLVRLEEAKKETKEGLLLSEGASKPSTTSGEVVKVGAGELLANGETVEMPLEPGDMVRFRYGDEVELDIGDDRFSAVKVSNCIAKWKVA